MGRYVRYRPVNIMQKYCQFEKKHKKAKKTGKGVENEEE
jgi:hypothetical protein